MNFHEVPTDASRPWAGDQATIERHVNAKAQMTTARRMGVWVFMESNGCIRDSTHNLPESDLEG